MLPLQLETRGGGGDKDAALLPDGDGVRRRHVQLPIDRGGLLECIVTEIDRLRDPLQTNVQAAVTLPSSVHQPSVCFIHSSSNRSATKPPSTADTQAFAHLRSHDVWRSRSKKGSDGCSR